MARRPRSVYLSERVSLATEELHIAPDGHDKGHVTDDGIWCSCLPETMFGAICPDGRVKVQGTVDATWPIVKIIRHHQHRNMKP